MSFISKTMWTGLAMMGFGFWLMWSLIPLGSRIVAREWRPWIGWAGGTLAFIGFVVFVIGAAKHMPKDQQKRAKK